MATRFMSIALATAVLSIVPTLLIAAPTSESLGGSNTAEALLFDLPEAPSHLRSRFYPAEGEVFFDMTIVSWRDNSADEDGFILETWRRQSGDWVLAGSLTTTMNEVVFGGSLGHNIKLRVKAFNASGDSGWSNWTH